MTRTIPTYTPGDTLEIFHSRSGDWAALYHNGVYVENSGGDSYHASEMIQAMLGVEDYYADDESCMDFLRGGNHYEHIAPTVADIEAYAADRRAKLARAAELRAEAEALEAQANEVVNS